jgi:hemoglobin-like flavoprotein
MTPEQKRLVRESWTQVQPIADTAARLFYDRLFETDPGARALFAGTDLAEQRRKLMLAITMAVGALDSLDALVPVIEGLGRRHAGYGVEDRHYESVGAALLWTLERGLGAAWTPALAAAWAETYALLSGVMRRAAAQSATVAA